MAKYKQVMQVSLCGNIERGAFDAVTVNGGDVMEIVGKHLRKERASSAVKSALRFSRKCQRRRKQMKLYEYAEQYEALEQMAEDESVPLEALADTLESIDDEFETKVDSIACIIKDELATAEAIKKRDRRADRADEAP